MTEPLRRGRPAWQLLVWVLLPLLVINWIVASWLLAPEARSTVSYTFFVTQVQRSNVAVVTSSGEIIEGELREAVDYQAYGESGRESVERFTTRRPSFADDNLFPLLQANGVEVNAFPPDSPGPLWLRLAAGLLPAVLITLLLAALLRRRPGHS
jgi:cell division protease FtsH